MRNAHSKLDILGEKRRDLNDYMAQFDGAVSMITSTVENLHNINRAIGDKIGEIEAYQSELEETKAGLLRARDKNTGVIANLRSLIGEG